MPLRESPQSCDAHIFHWLTTLDLDGTNPSLVFLSGESLVHISPAVGSYQG